MSWEMCSEGQAGTGQVVQGTGIGPWADRSEDGKEETGSPGVRVDGSVEQKAEA